ncbi:MAG: (2Fe-2S)-binding protein [Steroidobacteraceae bacterium]
MYVCICQGITDRQIRRAVDQGARTLGEVQMKLPVGGCCGRCEGSARELIREHAEQASCHADTAYGVNTAYA